MKYIVVKKEYSSVSCGDVEHYVGEPVNTEFSARMLAIKDFFKFFDLNEECDMQIRYFDNGTYLLFVSNVTGEILGEYFILVTNF